ncbi:MULTISPECIES: N-acetylmannosamine-6-phosphate 2-epimerase [unclassified Mesobacillus]|uniref:N-acetylmannosamine-6-phosphate 2-epimerase n=1 Tax=unclassified Mesobacillus TaxID=2675270 RepID=UPI00203C3A86|nr:MULTISPECIES: N-acetylmannosamine-6-phosphate 2-epimerase [unclassified Mesobacillus]MCM3123889.1 N-acetylmannosamine-6-phosphate 2-epimerase [Mesobacillus sp. MER 33]MCM3234096.1 N-acetylmannosamine-6-phosphate 2-epimerase [Mesobacillus sp. MER 48]
MLKEIHKGLVVSCQALENEPLHSPVIMGRMALAAEQGGAVGIRANTAADIKEIKKNVNLPVIGIVKQDYPDSEVYITPTIKEVDELVVAGAEMVAVDATNRNRPGGWDLKTFFSEVKKKYPLQMFMADVSTLEEAEFAQELGFDCVSTTLVGYTEGTTGQKIYENDFEVLKEMVAKVKVPVIAEGNILTPEMARRCLELGAHAVVVGGAITRPHTITRRFLESMEG